MGCDPADAGTETSTRNGPAWAATPVCQAAHPIAAASPSATQENRRSLRTAVCMVNTPLESGRAPGRAFAYDPG